MGLPSLVHTISMPNHQCPQCPKSFTRANVFREHVQTHSGEKPNRCENCGKGFAHSGDLWQHKKTHGEREHICHAVHLDGRPCQASFHRERDLLRHLKTCKASIATNLPPFEPSIGGFIASTSLGETRIPDTAMWTTSFKPGPQGALLGQPANDIDVAWHGDSFDLDSRHAGGHDDALTAYISPSDTVLASQATPSIQSTSQPWECFEFLDDTMNLDDNDVLCANADWTREVHMSNKLVAPAPDDTKSVESSVLALRQRPGGLPVSGCRNSTRRRIRCDLATPSCNRCRKRNLRCFTDNTSPRNHVVVPPWGSHLSQSSAASFPAGLNTSRELTPGSRWVKMNSPLESSFLDHTRDINWEKCLFKIMSALAISVVRSLPDEGSERQSLAILSNDLIKVIRCATTEAAHVMTYPSRLLHLSSISGHLPGEAIHHAYFYRVERSNMPRTFLFQVDVDDILSVHEALYWLLDQFVTILGFYADSGGRKLVHAQSHRDCFSFIAVLIGLLINLLLEFHLASMEWRFAREEAELASLFVESLKAAFLAEATLNSCYTDWERNGVKVDLGEAAWQLQIYVGKFMRYSHALLTRCKAKEPWTTSVPRITGPQDPICT